MERPAFHAMRTRPNPDARHPWPIGQRWFARRDACGLWVVVNGNGEQPLHSTDPAERHGAAHLVAAAPQIAEGLFPVHRQLERMQRRAQYVGDESITELSRAVAALVLLAIDRTHDGALEEQRRTGQRELALRCELLAPPPSWEIWTGSTGST